MENNTNINIPKKHQIYIDLVWKDSDGYWAQLTEASICDDTESHFVHEDTVKNFLSSLRNIHIMNEKTYVSLFGKSQFDEYKKDYDRLIQLGKLKSKNYREIK